MLQRSSVWTEIDPRYTCDGNGAWRGLHVCILSFLSLSSSSHSLFLSLSLSHNDTSFQPCSQNIYARVSLHAYSFDNASPVANNKRWGEHCSLQRVLRFLLNIKQQYEGVSAPIGMPYVCLPAPLSPQTMCRTFLRTHHKHCDTHPWLLLTFLLPSSLSLFTISTTRNIFFSHANETELLFLLQNRNTLITRSVAKFVYCDFESKEWNYGRDCNRYIQYLHSVGVESFYFLSMVNL